jgi:hypothetical protein
MFQTQCGLALDVHVVERNGQSARSRRSPGHAPSPEAYSRKGARPRATEDRCRSIDCREDRRGFRREGPVRRACAASGSVGSGCPVSRNTPSVDRVKSPAGATILVHQLPKPSRKLSSGTLGERHEIVGTFQIAEARIVHVQYGYDGCRLSQPVAQATADPHSYEGPSSAGRLIWVRLSSKNALPIRELKAAIAAPCLSGSIEMRVCRAGRSRRRWCRFPLKSPLAAPSRPVGRRPERRSPEAPMGSQRPSISKKPLSQAHSSP